jgi:pyruvate dehydrogenase E1 component alpha subunit
MRPEISEQYLIDCEKEIAEIWNSGVAPFLIHLSGGNEAELIKIFKEINPEDFIFSTHRSHYHYLLAGGSFEELKDLVMKNKSMFIFSKKMNFFTSSIVAGTPAIAAGVALSMKLNGDGRKVWCFVGDAAEDEGHFYEAVRFVDGHDLPCTFIIEDNDRSVNTSKAERRGHCGMWWPDCVRRYGYKPVYPHAGSGTTKKIVFKDVK